MPGESEGTIRVDPRLEDAQMLLYFMTQTALAPPGNITPTTIIQDNNSKSNTPAGTSRNRVKARRGRQPLKVPTSRGEWEGRLRIRSKNHSPSPIRQKGATSGVKDSNGKKGKKKPQKSSTGENEQQGIKQRQRPKTSKTPTTPRRQRLGNRTVQKDSIQKPLQLRRQRAKTYLDVTQRRKRLEEDDRCGEVEEHSVRCLICVDEELVQLDKRGKFYPWNWDKHLATNHPDSHLSRS